MISLDIKNVLGCFLAQFFIYAVFSFQLLFVFLGHWTFKLVIDFFKLANLLSKSFYWLYLG
jgi:hypothetical protein